MVRKRTLLEKFYRCAIQACRVRLRTVLLTIIRHRAFICRCPILRIRAVADVAVKSREWPIAWLCNVAMLDRIVVNVVDVVSKIGVITN